MLSHGPSAVPLTLTAPAAAARERRRRQRRCGRHAWHRRRICCCGAQGRGTCSGSSSGGSGSGGSSRGARSPQRRHPGISRHGAGQLALPRAAGWRARPGELAGRAAAQHSTAGMCAQQPCLLLAGSARPCAAHLRRGLLCRLPLGISAGLHSCPTPGSRPYLAAHSLTHPAPCPLPPCPCSARRAPRLCASSSPAPCPSCCSTAWTPSAPAPAQLWQSLAGRRGPWALLTWQSWCGGGSGGSRAAAPSR